jgi:putative membrane protein
MDQLFSSNNNRALFIALLFHVSGAIGILFTGYKDWFIQHTPLNLALMAVLLIWTQPKKNLSFFLFLFIAFFTGISTEMIGVNTGVLFGIYQYGKVMGYSWNGVPFIIGINWFVIVYCAGMVISQVHNWMEEKYTVSGIQLSPFIQTLSFIIDGALLTTFFDWLMEPVAVKLGFWTWLDNSSVTCFNYICWFLISAILLIIFRLLKFTKHNHFAVHLFIIQLLFFLLLRTFL